MKFWLLIRSFFEGARANSVWNVPKAEERPMNQQIVYAEFEAAISQWEKRTGLKVERSFGEAKDGIRYGHEWKNFATFLGSREAQEYRTKLKMSLGDMIKEMHQSPEMQITDEADDLDQRLREIGL